jgi:hypothetical protein
MKIKLDENYENQELIVKTKDDFTTLKQGFAMIGIRIRLSETKFETILKILNTDW